MGDDAGDFNVLGIDHVTVTAPQELESEVVGWYEQCLGLRQVDKPDGTRAQGAWFQIGAQQLHVSVDEHNPNKTAHVGLVVDDFRLVIERLRAAKCHIEQATEIPGRHRFFTRDPAGNQLEILSYDEGES